MAAERVVQGKEVGGDVKPVVEDLLGWMRGVMVRGELPRQVDSSLRSLCNKIDRLPMDEGKLYQAMFGDRIKADDVLQNGCRISFTHEVVFPGMVGVTVEIWKRQRHLGASYRETFIEVDAPDDHSHLMMREFSGWRGRRIEIGMIGKGGRKGDLIQLVKPWWGKWRMVETEEK